MGSLNKFEVHDDTVYIYRESWPKLGFTTYREDYYEELINLTWTQKGDYLFSNKLKKYLHRFIMEKWYGEEVVKDMYSKNFVIDHIKNNGFDCRITNLEFLPNSLNKAKGFQIDQQIDKFREYVALSIFKDFSTNYYQITMGFNAEIYEVNNEKLIPVIAAKLLYNCDYNIVIHDAYKIILDFNAYNRIPLEKLSFIDKKLEYPILVNTHKNQGPFMMINNEPFLVINDKNRIHSINYEKGWRK